MSISIKQAGQIYQPHCQAVGINWREYDHKLIQNIGLTREHNDANIGFALQQRPEAHVLILGSGRCRDFSLAPIVQRARSVTLVDLRDSPLKAAFRALPGNLQPRVQLVTADLSPFDTNDYYRRVADILRSTTNPLTGVSQFLRLLSRELPLDRDPLTWLDTRPDIVLLIGTISPMFYDYIVQFANLGAQRWGPFNGDGLFPTNRYFRDAVEKRFFQAFTGHLAQNVSPTALTYGVFYREIDWEEIYDVAYYRDCFSPGFQQCETPLPHPIPEQIPAIGHSNHGLLFEKA
ncbi:hypothetical protein A2311_05770 [candidate division WOR-1 bacterium RIFOXYB2_FULL_48_7]|uniref:Uncharacterized protein n=1 Tax=candidate division WOR-1 bacterium RIFOXYB2_FULL_48_7 TaxID=1802583 RepID=A0A1F4TUE3_UNCSA|nr:MAG: hypothetical protein A2311_05770 [candidate division WOR-1 bacterium RIFOXYB2_FULL_48_7]